MKYVSIDGCKGCALTALYYDSCDTLYLAFGDRYTRIRATNSYDSVERALEQEERDRRDYEMLKAKFGE